jgi:tetratricopeptide (TPR) repeat protein
MGTDNTSLP